MKRLVALAALAFTAPAAHGSEAVHLSYAVYAHGFRAMILEVTVAFNGDRYRITMADHTVGLVSAFLTNRVASDASGTLAGSVPHPSRFESAGYSRGANRRTVIDYAGDDPKVDVLSPVEPRRDKVPASATVGSVDSLSAVAGLIREVATTGRCDASIHVFDGARLTEIISNTEGDAPLSRDDRSPYTGTALRCDFTTRLLAGFLHNQNYAKDHQPQHGTAWVAPAMPGSAPVPLRVEFTTVDHGPISIFLQSADHQDAS